MSQGNRTLLGPQFAFKAKQAGEVQVPDSARPLLETSARPEQGDLTRVRSGGLATDVSALDEHVKEVRGQLVKSSDMAVGHLIYAALEHAAESITHSDRKIKHVCTALASGRSEDSHGVKATIAQLSRDITSWAARNKFKATFMVVGFAGAVAKADTLKKLINDQAQGFIDWGNAKSTTTGMRFVGICGLMTVRLFVSTVVPPTSPVFSIIISQATPDDEKWTATWFFLAASIVAGVVPTLLDKFLSICFGRDFVYTESAKWFSDNWPLTCWTGPAMYKVFGAAGGGKLGSSLAVIVAHAAPFMGAQTTNMQRYFLPHPVDTIISQPFGMSEDLITMAMAEASGDPALASHFLTGLLVFFNFLAYAVFSGRQDTGALMCMVFNLLIGCAASWLLPHGEGLAGFGLVGLQLFLQMFVSPTICSCLCSCFEATTFEANADHEAETKGEAVVENPPSGGCNKVSDHVSSV